MLHSYHNIRKNISAFPLKSLTLSVLVLFGLCHCISCADSQTTISPHKSGSSKNAPNKAIKPDSTLKSPVSFSNEIIPILTRYGCNQGICHGAQYGKGGFKLSLAGFDPDLDYTNIARQSRGRRVAAAAPAQSLLLLKPSLAMPHGGGKKLDGSSADYQTLLRWVQEGMPPPKNSDPVVTKIEVSPAEKILQKTGDVAQLTVIATFSDGKKRDVTAHTRLNSLNDAVVSCSPEGKVVAINRGQSAIMVRYGGQAAVSILMVPFSTALNLSPKATKPKIVSNSSDKERGIDLFVNRKLSQLGLVASSICDDRAFIRRVGFDLIGTPPTQDEIALFFKDRSTNKRQKLVDSLLARSEYADFWTLKWGDLLRSNRTNLTPKGMWSFTNWIHAQIGTNRPVNQIVRDLLLSQGSTFTNGPANYFRVATNPQDLAETTSQVFLGVRLQCAKCHHHPFEKWTQADYYQFAAFFARVSQKGSGDFGLFGNETVIRVQDGGEVYHPKTGAKMSPTPLGIQLAAIPAGGKAPDPDADGDRRKGLADWLAGKDNRLFARNIVNRYWGYLLSKGIVNPIDDLRVTNPPTNPELLEYLTDELISHNFDLKSILRLICNSKTYQRSSEANWQNEKDELFFTHYYPKRLSAESLLDAIDYACGTREKFNELPLGTKAIQLPDPLVNNDFLDTFGRPQRLIACECERVAEPNLSQTLRLMNGNGVNAKIADGNGRIAKRLAEKHSDDYILKELYLSSVGRAPNPRERKLVMAALGFSSETERKPIFEDVLLTLLNSKEFLLNH